MKSIIYAYSAFISNELYNLTIFKYISNYNKYLIFIKYILLAYVLFESISINFNIIYEA